MNYAKQLQAIANEYFAETGDGASAREIAVWALSHGKWQPTSDLALRRLAEDLARAMRAEYRRDPQGRTVRAKHAARVRRNGKTEAVWNDQATASRGHMVISLIQRRDGIVGDCKMLKSDVDSYNENRCPDDPIQMSFNFTNDLIEAEAAEQAMGGSHAA